MFRIDYTEALTVPGAVQGFHVESPVLPKLGWLPQNGNRGASPVNTDAAQDFSRYPPLRSPMPYPGTIGYVMGLLPLMDIWRFGMGVARLPFGPYTGGDFIRGDNRTEFGVNSSPMNIPKLLG